jgi:peptidoglycan/xylan/chitin deacetylase (PgdA/CDA1 family)
MFSSENNYIIVNYHYVEDPRPDQRGITPCSVADFERQIEFLANQYQIVSVAEVFEAAKKNAAGKFCVLTFDDGLKDQLENAVPILKKRRLPAAFFIITSVFSGRLPTAHKIHQLLSRVSAAEIIDKFNGFMAEFYPDLRQNYFIPKDRRLTQKRLHEDPANANFKEVMIMLPEDIKGRFLRFSFKRFGLNEKNISRQLFMDQKEIRDLRAQDMTIGSHSHNHYAFNVVNEEVLSEDIRLSREILSDILGTPPAIMSYPHGRSNETAVKILQREGFQYAVTIERRGVAAQDNPFFLPRYDTGDIRDYFRK